MNNGQLTVSVVRIATAEDGQRTRVAAQEGGAWAEALSVGAVGAKGGAVVGPFFGPGPGTAIGCHCRRYWCGIVCGFLGEKAAWIRLARKRKTIRLMLISKLSIPY